MNSLKGIKKPREVSRGCYYSYLLKDLDLL